ncbi:MAG: molybdopterin-dependent oxidoreductase [Archangium sp.]|nr:molybdopterin-dependent oxidoreductase [Archangium sp.]
MTAFLVAPLAVALLAAPVSSVAVKGAVPTPKSFSVKELEALGATDATWTDHGKQRSVRGAPLEAVLKAVGFSPGPMGPDVAKREKRSGWKMVVRVTATDGFQAVFSCAELWSEMGPTRALLVWQLDGKVLGAEDGPLRVVVPTDKEPSRSVRNVATIEVLDLRT